MNRTLAVLLAVGIALVATGLLVTLLKSDSDGDAKIVQRGWASGSPEGPVRFCSGDDVSGAQRRAERDYNRRFSGSMATFDEASFIADSQHDLYLKLIQDGKDDCDVIYLDVIYMAEFADKGLLYDMSPYLSETRQADFDDQMIESVRGDESVGCPQAARRRDHVLPHRRGRPADQLAGRLPAGHAHDSGRAAGAAATGRRLRGADRRPPRARVFRGAVPIVSEDGKTAHVNQPEVLEALRFMRNAIREGVTPDVERREDRDRQPRRLRARPRVVSARLAVRAPAAARRRRDRELAGRQAGAQQRQQQHADRPAAPMAGGRDERGNSRRPQPRDPESARHPAGRYGSSTS